MALSQSQYKLLDAVDQHAQYTVYGFIREIESTFKASINIPVEIIKICTLYFWWGEYFENCGESFIIDREQKDTITKINTMHDGWNNMVLGYNWLESNTSNIIRWTFELIKSTESNDAGLYIGITSKNHHGLNHNAGFVAEVGTQNYFYFYPNYLVHNGLAVDKYWKKPFTEQGSILMMELNLKKGHISFTHDNEFYGIAFDNIKQDDDTKYKLAVGLYDEGVALKLVSFSVKCLK